MRAQINKNQYKKGFTLIELLVVVAIVSLLSSIVFASLNTARAKARDSQRIQALHQISLALDLYLNDHGYYPPSSCGWDCNGYSNSYDSTWTTLGTALAPYISKLPVDPINSACSSASAVDGCFSYAYGNVGKDGVSGLMLPHSFDLFMQFEDKGSPLRCGAKDYLSASYYTNHVCPGGLPSTGGIGPSYGGPLSNYVYKGGHS